MYITTITLTGVLYGYFASSGCTQNRFFISFNLALCIISTLVSIHPAVQDSNPRSGLAQSGMVAAYCTYLITSAVTNHAHNSCNPLTRSSTTGTTAVVLGAVFTFLAIAYSTSRAATQSRALVGKGKKGGAVHLPIDDGTSEMGVVSTQPGRTESPRYQALLAAVQAGYVSLSLARKTCSSLDITVLFPSLHYTRRKKRKKIMGKAGTTNVLEPVTMYGHSSSCCYTADPLYSMLGSMSSLLSGQCMLQCCSQTGRWSRWLNTSVSSPHPFFCRNVVSTEHGGAESEEIVHIGRSETAMWMRVVSSWVCMLLYMWSLLAPVFMPDR